MSQRPLYDPDERIFTLSDIKKLISRQKTKLIKACWGGAFLAFSFVLITFAPKYQIFATFKEAPNQERSGISGLDKLVGSFGSSALESQTIAVTQSLQVLKPLVEKMGLQATVKEGGLLSKVYRRIKDNLLAERENHLSDIDGFSFRNVEYLGENDLSYHLSSMILTFFNPVRKEGTRIGVLGSPVYLPEVKLTIVKAPKNLQFKRYYPLSVRTWISAVKAVRSQFRMESSKNQKAIFELRFFSSRPIFRDRVFKCFNGRVSELFAKRPRSAGPKPTQLPAEKQEEICDRMSAAFDEYTEYLQVHLAESGQLGLKQEIETITKEHQFLSGKIFSIDLELDGLNRISMDPKTCVPMDSSPLFQSVKTTVEAIANLKQQRDFIELSLASQDRAFNESQYENRKEELKVIRDQMGV